MTLDQWFDADSLSDLRSAVLAEAVAAGLAGTRAADIVLAVHELAANAVRHGGGSGRLRMQTASEQLHCHVTDEGPAGAVGAPAWARSTLAVGQWLIRPGHGLWLVRDVADHLDIAAGPAGAEVSAAFNLPARNDAQ